MKIQAIKTSDGYFVTAEGMNSYNNTLTNIVFDRKELETTWKQGWYKISDITGNIERKIPEKKEIEKYQLKEEYEATSKTPQTVELEFFESDSYDEPHPLRGLYEPVFKIIPVTYVEETDVEIEVVAELEGKLVEEKINFPVYGQYPNTDGKNWSVKNTELKLGLVDELVTPEILKEERPCELSSANSYKIIRTHIKDNIDPKVATISSDYDFCLTVEKRIPLAEKETYQVDENFTLFSRRKRKPKLVTKYRVERRKEIYKIAPKLNGKVYSEYPETPIFRGENARNLKSNINEYLSSLMKEINKPLKDCPTCKGCGVID